MVSPIRRLVLAAALLMAGAPLPASAALIAAPAPLLPAGGSGSAPDHDITGLTIDLTLDATHPNPETTHLAYDVALGDDGTATTWAVVGFAVIRAWNEGAVVGSPESPAEWGGAVTDHFADWTTGGAGIGEGDHLGGFGYTVARSTVPSQMYLYWVTKDGATPFQVISSNLPVVAGAAVPEPASAALMVGAIGALWAVRRRG